MKTNPNIIFIVLDACRASHLSCYGYDMPTSPNINKIAEEGVLFTNAFSTTNVTDISLCSIFSGQYPISHGVTVQAKMGDIVNPGVKFLPEILKSHGYKTIAIDWLSRYHERGYDRYGYLLEKPTGGGIKTQALNIRNILKFLLPYDKIPSGVKGFLKHIYNRILPDWHPRWYDAKRTTDTALKLLEKEKSSNRSFFMFIHYWDSHTPYNAPESHWRRFLKNKRTELEIRDILDSCIKEDVKKFYSKWMNSAKNVQGVLSRYDGAISYMDEQIDRIYDYLEENGMLDNTLLLITSDHGECLLEHGIYFDHHGGLYDEILHVPLIIRYPDLLPMGKKIDSLVQHTDIVPMILEILNIKWKIKDEGVSFLPAMTDNKKIRDYVYAVMDNEEKYVIRSLKYKYIMRNKLRQPYKKYRDQQGIMDDEELYDLKSDPGELINLVKDQQEIKYKFNYRLNQHLKKLKEKTENLEINDKEEIEDIDQKLKDRLRALGYLDT